MTDEPCCLWGKKAELAEGMPQVCSGTLAGAGADLRSCSPFKLDELLPRIMVYPPHQSLHIYSTKTSPTVRVIYDV